MKQREISFRVWDGTMRYVDLYYFEEEGIRELPDKYAEHLRVMQSTGRTDDFGRMLYEGDICIGTYSGSSAPPILHQISWSDAEFGWSFGNSPLWTWEKLEVLGNIYEHKSLLTPPTPNNQTT